MLLRQGFQQAQGSDSCLRAILSLISRLERDMLHQLSPGCMCFWL